MAKQKVAQPKPLHNNMEVQSGVNLTSVTVSSQLNELETSGIIHRNTTTNQTSYRQWIRSWGIRISQHKQCQIGV